MRAGKRCGVPWEYLEPCFLDVRPGLLIQVLQAHRAVPYQLVPRNLPLLGPLLILGILPGNLHTPLLAQHLQRQQIERKEV